MAPRFGKLRPAPWAAAMVAWDVWKHLTPAQRRRLLALARRHGPTVASKVTEQVRRRRRP